jgi:dynein heavy chain
MEEQVAKYHKAVLKMERGLAPNKVMPLLRETVNVWRGKRARAT